MVGIDRSMNFVDQGTQMLARPADVLFEVGTAISSFLEAKEFQSEAEGKPPKPRRKKGSNGRPWGLALKP
jgi:hypothetical protein